MANNWDMIRLFESINKTKIKGSLIKESFEDEQEFSDNKQGMNSPNPAGDSDYNDILNSYLETALWADAEEGNDDFEGKTIHDIDANSKAEALNDIKQFVKIASQQAPEELKTYSDEQLGHNFWLSRNGHGSGFFDDNNDKLQDIARNMKGKYIYSGDDHNIYIQEEEKMGGGKKKVLAKDLKAGDHIVGLGKGLKVVRGAQAGINTPSGKIDIMVEYPDGKKQLKVWNKNTVIAVHDKQEPTI